MNKNLRQLVLSALVIGLGIGFPYAFHLFGGGLGPYFLPMFLPLMIGAFFLRAPFSVFTGIATPLLSGLIPPGMPPLMIGMVMAVELAAVCGIISILSSVRKPDGEARYNVWIILIVAVVLDRLIILVLAAGLGRLFGLPPFLYTWGSIIQGLPGIALQFIIIPPVVKRLGIQNATRA